MKKYRTDIEGLPNGPLHEALQIEREENAENNIPLSLKLQEELTKPLNDEIREESVETDRIGKLRVPDTGYFAKPA